MSKRSKIIIGIVIVLVLTGGIFWIWNSWTGKYKIGADAVIGCQGPRAISQFFGSAGRNLTGYNLFGHEVSINEKIIPFLDAVQKDVNDAKTGYNFNNITTYNYRSKRGGGGQSLHSWGIAVDINPADNPYQLGNYGSPQTDIPPKIVEIFRKHGFIWGGEWVGEYDSMHFEWYGGEIKGSVIDGQSQQKIIDVSTFINGAGAPNANGDFDWTVEFGTHTITAKAKGYEDAIVKIDLPCFQNQQLNIVMKPLPENTPGQISGRVTLVGNKATIIPATIYLDGKVVGAANVRGDYVINNVRRGKHKVSAQVMFFPGVETQTSEMKPGEDIKNFNITIGKP